MSLKQPNFQPNPDEAIFGGLGAMSLPRRPAASQEPPPPPPDNAIIMADDGTLAADRFRITLTGLELPDDLTMQEWEAVGKVVKIGHDAGAWLVGDHAVYANRRWGIPYETTAKTFGYEASTVKQYAYVCSNFAPDARLAGAYFGCHRLLVGKGHNTQKLRSLIRKAVAEDGRPLSVREFEALIFDRPAPEKQPKFRTEPVAYIDHQTSALRDKIIERADKLNADERRQMADLFRLVAQQIEELPE